MIKNTLNKTKKKKYMNPIFPSLQDIQSVFLVFFNIGSQLSYELLMFKNKHPFFFWHLSIT